MKKWIIAGISAVLAIVLCLAVGNQATLAATTTDNDLKGSLNEKIAAKNEELAELYETLEEEKDTVYSEPYSGYINWWEYAEVHSDIVEDYKEVLKNMSYCCITYWQVINYGPEKYGPETSNLFKQYNWYCAAVSNAKDCIEKSVNVRNKILETSLKDDSVPEDKTEEWEEAFPPLVESDAKFNKMLEDTYNAWYEMDSHDSEINEWYYGDDEAKKAVASWYYNIYVPYREDLYNINYVHTHNGKELDVTYNTAYDTPFEKLIWQNAMTSKLEEIYEDMINWKTSYDAANQ